MSATQHRTIETNGIRLHVAEQGQGPLVLLLHGFPESWYSWRHQLSALADAGYHAVAPDLRGYGDSDKPHAVEAYDQVELAADVAGLITALGEKQAVVVGHDWGAPVAWNSALLHPDRVRAVVGMSVPYGGRGKHPPLARFRELFKDVFFYMIYFQDEGVAERELEADVRTSLRKFYLSASGDARTGGAFAAHPKSAKVLDTLFDDGRVPSFLNEQDLDYFTSQFEKSGFRGPINFYRNFDRTWERTASLADAKISQPALFIAGKNDPVLVFSAAQLERRPQLAPQLRGTLLFDGAGHWIQQERVAETNRALLDFLRDLPA
ncbi:MAG TPA: alpha/beta hydrolase [Polyangiales bacterium]|nr:alpha/beta hydrolase [Polyangiales bacterium]